MELVAATVASGFLLAGLASVMLIGQQVAYTPTAAMRRTEAADVVNQIAEELRYATLIIQQTPQILEFVVSDRNSDGTAEKIRYAWSGTAGDPLYKTINSGTAIQLLDGVEAFTITLLQDSTTTTLTTTTDSAEVLLSGSASVGANREINASNYLAQQINPATFPSIPANAMSWNATRVETYARDRDAGNTLYVQLRSAADPNDGPTSSVLAQASFTSATLSDNFAWGNVAIFSGGVRDLDFHRRYTIVWAGSGAGDAARLTYLDGASGGVLDSSDGGATWTYTGVRQTSYRLYGTYTTPGTSYSVTRNYVSNVQVAIRSGQQDHSRIDANIPLANSPELLSAYWRADFSSNPTSTNVNGDSVADWSYSGSGSFDGATLINGVWYASGALESRPLSDFTTKTIVEARCRNTTVGGYGAVLRINADRQGGQYAPLLVYVRRQSDGTQTLSVHGKTSDAITTTLYTRANLSTEFIRFRLLVLPQNNVVNVQINDEDQGTFTYPTYVPSNTTDRFVTFYADTSLAEFDYVDVRSAAN
jgi:hypothetical protein